MKIIKNLIFFFIPLIAFSQTNESADEVKSAVENLFEICKSGNFEKAAGYIAYMDDDKSRYLNDSYDFNNSNEAKKVKRIAKKINAFLKLSDKYEFGEYETMDDGGKQITSIQVIFISGSQQLKTQFSFVKINELLMLSDLN
ncbi:MAG: hypothetical protein JW995_09740 [Melioribacteraceae bacterium]|nr:hypothetical protein [Melioribacteraceae bacterium]